MKQFKWKGYNWYAETHAKITNFAYFTEDAVYIDEDNNLRLTIIKKPLDIVPLDAKVNHPVHYEYGVGEICGEGDWSYGIYEWWTSQTKAPKLWSAVWLCGRYLWPPEIDVFECYSKNNKRIHYETNIHSYGSGKGIFNCGAKPICRLLYKKVNYWKCVWTREFIKIYLNGFLVRKVTDKEIMTYFRGTPYMYPIMNMQVNMSFEDKDYINNVYDLTIYDFKYTPKK